MRFSGSVGPAGSFGRHALSSVRRDHFLCGGLLLLVGGWVALHPPPKAPDLPSAYRTHLRAQYFEQQHGPYWRDLVWVDMSSGCYYSPSDINYGATTHGRFLEIKKARAHGYRPGAVIRSKLQ